MSEIDPSAFDGFVQIPCDKCKTVSCYSPDIVNSVTECFGCKCDRLHKYEVHCPCGWHGKWFEDMPLMKRTMATTAPKKTLEPI